MDEEMERNNRAEGLGPLLRTQLQKLGERRAMTAEELTPPASNVRYLPSIPEPERITYVPATSEEIIAELMVLDLIFPFPTFSTEERSLRYRVFCKDLAPYPIEMTRHACEEYRKGTFKYYPTPGQLINCMPMADRWAAESQARAQS